MLWLRMMLTKNTSGRRGRQSLGRNWTPYLTSPLLPGIIGNLATEPSWQCSRGAGNDAVILNGIDGLARSTPRGGHDALFDLCGKIMESTSSLEVERRTQHSINIIEALGRSLEGQAERDKGTTSFC